MNLSQWQASLTDQQLVCRDLHHAWEYGTVTRVKGAGFTRTLHCRSCGTLKVQVLDRHGYLLKSKYEYAEGYVRPAGAGHISKEENAEFRLANLKERNRNRA